MYARAGQAETRESCVSSSLTDELPLASFDFDVCGVAGCHLALHVGYCNGLQPHEVL